MLKTKQEGFLYSEYTYIIWSGKYDAPDVMG